jgi:hypothetical protein
VEHEAGFDPLWLRPDASLNRTLLAPLPRAVPRWVGQKAFDLLSREALLRLVSAVGTARAAEESGRRLGHLIATLQSGAGAEMIRSNWRLAYRVYWTSVEEVWLGGGLAAYLGSGLLAGARAEAARLGASRPSIELAGWPAALPLIGAARSNSGTAPRAVVLDFGHTAVKRGLATYRGRRLAGLQLLDSLDPPAPASLVDAFIEAVAATLRCVGADVDPTVVVSVASYVDPNSRIAPDGYSLYSPLGAVEPAALDRALRDCIGNHLLHLRLVHDGTAAASGVVPTVLPAAVITLGTALGVGFAPRHDQLRPLTPDFSVTDAAG